MSGEVSGSIWSDREIDLIIADYFAMLADELARRPFNKAEHNRALQQLTGRSSGSIERKHQNISAVLVRLGRRWIIGYKPLSNFQKSLIDGIERYLSTEGDLSVVDAEPPTLKVAEAKPLWIGPPPTPAKDERAEPPALRRLIKKRHPCGRPSVNRLQIRVGGERP